MSLELLSFKTHKQTIRWLINHNPQISCMWEEAGVQRAPPSRVSNSGPSWRAVPMLTTAPPCSLDIVQFGPTNLHCRLRDQVSHFMWGCTAFVSLVSCPTYWDDVPHLCLAVVFESQATAGRAPMTPFFNKVCLVKRNREGCVLFYFNQSAQIRVEVEVNLWTSLLPTSNRIKVEYDGD